MNRIFTIENGRRVSKCGARHIKQFPAVVMNPALETAKTVKKKEAVREPIDATVKETEKESNSLFDSHSDSRESAIIEDEY